MGSFRVLGYTHCRDRKVDRVLGYIDLDRDILHNTRLDLHVTASTANNPTGTTAIPYNPPVADGKSNEEEKFDFTGDGGSISTKINWGLFGAKTLKMKSPDSRNLGFFMPKIMVTRLGVEPRTY